MLPRQMRRIPIQHRLPINTLLLIRPHKLQSTWLPGSLHLTRPSLTTSQHPTKALTISLQGLPSTQSMPTPISVCISTAAIRQFVRHVFLCVKQKTMIPTTSTCNPITVAARPLSTGSFTQLLTNFGTKSLGRGKLRFNCMSNHIDSVTQPFSPREFFLALLCLARPRDVS